MRSSAIFPNLTPLYLLPLSWTKMLRSSSGVKGRFLFWPGKSLLQTPGDPSGCVRSSHVLLGRPHKPQSRDTQRGYIVTYSACPCPPGCHNLEEEKDCIHQNQSQPKGSPYEKREDQPFFLGKASKKLKTQKALAKVSTEQAS